MAVFGHGGGVGDGGIQALDAVVGGGLQVHCVVTGAVADQHLQVRVACLKNGAGHLGDADDDGIRLMLLHIRNDVFRLKAPSVDQRAAVAFQQVAGVLLQFLGK